MSHASAVATTTHPIGGVEAPSIPLAQLAPWLVFVGLLASLAIFFVSADQGAISIPAGTLIHEFVHDGRHLLGYPCH